MLHMIRCPYVSYISFMIKMEKGVFVEKKEEIFLKGRSLYE